MSDCCKCNSGLLGGLGCGGGLDTILIIVVIVLIFFPGIFGGNNNCYDNCCDRC